MDTPRRSLIRATEHAIEEYIKDGCEDNLPMIRQLEDVAYQFWVESNTSFLNESVVTAGEDEEGWIWDDDCLFQSFSAHVEDCLQDDKCVSGNLPEEADDTSSICSSIKPCDETDCSLGYLASFEDSVSTHASVDLCKETLPCGDDFVEHFTDNQPTARTDLEEINTFHGGQRSCECGADVKERGYETNKVIIDNVNTIGESPENGNDLDVDVDEWVVVGRDCIDTSADNDWFIVSTAEPRGCATDTFQPRRSGSVNVRAELPENNEKENSADVERNSEKVDLSDWAVLSMRVSERTDTDETERPKLLKQTLRKSGSVLNGHTNEHVLIDSISDAYGMTTFGGCPLCKSTKDNYQCAIVCVLMQR